MFPTVKNRIQATYRKLQVHDGVNAVLKARELGFDRAFTFGVYIEIENVQEIIDIPSENVRISTNFPYINVLACQ